MGNATITWHVYQLRSETGELLYVGHSRWLKTRIRQHRNRKTWWPEVARIQSEEFTGETEARLREQEIWVAEQPKYNQVNPFRTLEYELSPRTRERRREREYARKRTPEYRAQSREYDRKRGKRTPERLARQREYDRKHQRRTARPWQQEGPGLF